MDSILQDLRFALRTLRKSPAFTAIAVLCLALGIGINSTIFSVVNATMLRPFPFADPDRLIFVRATHLADGHDDEGLSYQNFLDVKQRARSLADVGAFVWGRSLTFGDGTEPERVLGSSVSWNLFPMIGVKPMLGRGFREDEDRPGAPGVVLLSHELWQRRYAGDASVLGRAITINDAAHTVIGVMPPRFAFPERNEAWTPLAPIAHADPRSAHDAYGVQARLRPGVTLERAHAELLALGRALEVEHPVENRGWGLRATSLRDVLVGREIRLIILTMLGAVSFVLLIACANVANLMLARATSRQREVAVRAALGAGRWRIVRQLLTESVLVALAAGLLGIFIAVWGLDLIKNAFPPEDQVPYFIEWSTDWRVASYTLAVAVLTGLVFGIAPAAQATRASLVASLKDGARGAGAGARGSRLRGALVVTEVALSLVLLVGASLFVRSFMKLQAFDGGVDANRLMTMRFFMPGDRYASVQAKRHRVEDIVRRLEAIPAVEAATASNFIPIDGGGQNATVEVEGRQVTPGSEPTIIFAGVTAHFIRTVGAPLVAGRAFTDREGSDSSGVAVIDQFMAKRLWPDESPLGKRFRFVADSSRHWITVIGVARDLAQDELLFSDKDPMAYLPYAYLATRNTGVVIRVAAGDPARVTAAAREAIRASDRALPVFQVHTMEAVRQLSFWESGLFGWMFSIFGGVALFLAAIGVYGVIAYGVTQRTHEIGVRVALGARAADVLRLVVGRGVLLTALGVLFGLVGAIAVTRVTATLLFNVSPTDPLSFIGVAVFLVGVSAFASYVPARRATRVDPLEALRAE
ncbi:MAG: ABC transporter permease [Gemmatimonadaceae bacterium]